MERGGEPRPVTVQNDGMFCGTRNTWVPSYRPNQKGTTSSKLVFVSSGVG